MAIFNGATAHYLSIRDMDVEGTATGRLTAKVPQRSNTPKCADSQNVPAVVREVPVLEKFGSKLDAFLRFALQK